MCIKILYYKTLLLLPNCFQTVKQVMFLLLIYLFLVVPLCCECSSKTCGLEFSFDGASEDCITEFWKFERCNILKNQENLKEIFNAFYPVNEIFPLSVQVSFLQQNGKPITSKCEQEIFLWVPYSLFVIMEPTKWNAWGLNMLSFFTPWQPRRLTLKLHSPYPCKNSTFEFFTEVIKKVKLPLTYHLHNMIGAHYYRQ